MQLLKPKRVDALKSTLRHHDEIEVTLLPEEPEDMWHIYNLLSVGDRLRASAIRKVQHETGTGTVVSERIRMDMCVVVVAIDFDTEGCALRVKGRNVEENPHIKLGQHHTIDLELNRKLTIIKDEWDSIAVERIVEACDVRKYADLAAVVMDEGRANICLVTSSMTLVRAKIEVAIPRKRSGNGPQREKAILRFYDMVLEGVLRHVDFAVVKAVIVASPGFIKDKFVEYVHAEAIRRNLRVLIDNRAKFFPVHVHTGHVQSLKEALADSVVLAQLADTKAAGEVRALDAFYKMLAEDEDRAFYGEQHVTAANAQHAVETLLVTDALFRSKSIEERRRYVALVDSVRENGGDVRIFSTLHPSGRQLAQLSGVAAILRFPLPNVADLEGESSDDDEFPGDPVGA